MALIIKKNFKVNELFKLTMGLTFSLFWFSCGHIEHQADVVHEQRTTSPVSQALKKTRFQILQNKNALRIALLKLNWGNKSNQKQGRTLKNIVLETSLLSFMGPQRQSWSQLALARLHGQLLPEFYQLIRLSQNPSYRLHVLCVDKATCELFKQNLSQTDLKRIKIYTMKTSESLRRVRPHLVLSSHQRYFNKLQNSSSWQDWETKWVQLKLVESSGLLTPDDLARVVPTVHEF
jgi:hypothetical protein